MRKTILFVLFALPLCANNNFYLSPATGSYNFSNPAAWTRSISAISLANPAVVTSTAHGINLGGANGMLSITIAGGTGTGWTAVNATWTATVIDANTFSIPIDSTGFGTLGGTVTFTEGSPDDGDYVTWKSTGELTFDSNIGTSGNGIKTIRIENGTFTATPGITITFGSTCTGGCTAANINGSGTALNPGADATMHGLMLAKLSGTSSISGTAASRITLTTGTTGSQFYIRHTWGDFLGCTAFTSNVCNGSTAFNDGPSMTFTYLDVMGLGANVSNFRGITMQENDNPVITETIDHCRFYSPNQVLSAVNNNTSVVFTNNTIYYPQYLYTVSMAGGGSLTATDNAEIVGTTGVTGYLIFTTAAPVSIDIERNAVENTATVARSLRNGTAYALLGTFRGNLWVAPEGLTNAQCFIGTFPTIDKNICQGTRSIPLGVNATTGTLNLTNNWTSQYKEEWAGQGNYITDTGYVASGVLQYNFTDEVMIIENSDSTHSPMALLAYTSSGTNFVQVAVAHVTVLSSPFAGLGLSMGETIDSNQGGVANSSVQSSIVTSGGYGSQSQIKDGHPHNTWSPLYNGSGANYNDTYGSVGLAYGPTVSVGFDNGTVHHPNALYGDLTVDPQYMAVTRRPCDYDAVLGGPGTCDSLFARLATRALGTSGCTVCGTYSGTTSLIETIRLWLFQGAQATNLALKGVAHDGGDIGATTITVFNSPGGIGAGGAAF